METIYLDNNATTRPDASVISEMVAAMAASYGNPSSTHAVGHCAREIIEGARDSLAGLLNCDCKEIVFTSSGTEANNLAILGAAKNPGHIILTATEHPSVKNLREPLIAMGFDVTIIDVNRSGILTPAGLVSAIRRDTVLISVMTANNETGVIQPIKELCREAHARGILFHTDAVQAVGKLGLDVRDLDIDMLSLSAHKFYGPKGVGALYIREGVRLAPITYGGGQESGLRSGTENVPGIAGIGRAADLARQNILKMEGIKSLRDRLFDGIEGLIKGAVINGSDAPRLPNTLSVMLPGLNANTLSAELDKRGVCVSTGSACHSSSPVPPYCLTAMGLSPEEAFSTIRFSLGLDSTAEMIDRAIMIIDEIISDGLVVME